ncbi:M1 family peptidase [Nakamurella silvestris]|nr:M1 family peptidase [Nakamurella silvestris]
MKMPLARLPHLSALGLVLVLSACGSTVDGVAELPSTGFTAPATGPTVPASTPDPSPSATPTIPTSLPDTTPEDPSTSGSAPVSPTVPAVDGEVGATGIGDPYYPESGNGGYDVQDYLVELTWNDKDSSIQAKTTIAATVTSKEKLGQFSFDFQETLKVASVTINDRPTAFEQTPAKLVLTPEVGLEPDSDLVVVVTYSGVPNAVSHGTAGLGDGGWVTLPDGGAVVAGEPLSASTWFPANEHPLDRASFQVIATVPEGWSVISNGLPIDDLPAPATGSAVFGWREKAPMATYLTTLYIDKFTTTTGTTGDGVPIINAFAPNGGDKFGPLAEKTAGIVDFLSSTFGTYPFESVGGIYSNLPLSFALETQTRPVYADWVDLDTVVHELAHQWYGDDIAVKSWADICLNECFASYAPWLYREATEGEDLDATYRQNIAAYKGDKSFWASPLVDMGAGNEFTAVYSRGPLALHALRNEIGDDAMDALLSGWVKEKAGKNVSFDEWEAYVNDVAGKDLTPFLDAWFRGTTIPAKKYLFPGSLAG